MADKLLGLSQTLSAQLWVGRLAMAGFLTSCVEEIITGKGTLQQIGLFTPNPALFGFLLVFFGGLTAYATAPHHLPGHQQGDDCKVRPPSLRSGAKPGILLLSAGSGCSSKLPSACDCLACHGSQQVLTRGVTSPDCSCRCIICWKVWQQLQYSSKV